MRIAFLNPQGNFDPVDRYWTAHPDFGGQLVYVKEVALAVAGLGHRADILTRRIVDTDWDGFEGHLDTYPGESGVRIVRLDCGPAGFIRKELLWPYLHEWTEEILAFYGDDGDLPDLWTGHYADGGLVAAILSEATGRPFTLTGHSLGAQKLERLAQSAADLPGLEAEYHFGARLSAERFTMSRAGRIVVSTRQEQREQYGHHWYAGAIDAKDDDRFAVIPPGVNLQVFVRSVRNAVEASTRDKVDRTLARDLPVERLNLPCVLASARLEPKKNHIGLARAYLSSPELQASANLLFSVRGLPCALEGARVENLDLPAEARTILAELQEMAQAHNLWGKLATISLEGQDELAAAYRYLAERRSLFCLPAHHEPFGLAPLEAMASGLPVVSTRFGGPSESMVDQNGEYGVLVDPNDPADLVAGLLRLVNDPVEWACFQRAGHQRALDRYTWERTAGSYATLAASLSNELLRAEGLPLHPYFQAQSRVEPSLDELVTF